METPAQKNPRVELTQDSDGNVIVEPKQADDQSYPPGTTVTIPGVETPVVIGEDGTGKIPNSELPTEPTKGTPVITVPGGQPTNAGHTVTTPAKGVQAVNGELPQPLELSELQLIITKWLDEEGRPLKSEVSATPEDMARDLAAFEHGSFAGYIFSETTVEENVVTHVFRKVASNGGDTSDDFIPVVPSEKTPVKNLDKLTDAEKAAVKKKVEDANPGKTVTVDDKGNATVTDPTSGKTAIIPSTDLVEKSDDFIPVVPSEKTPVKNLDNLTDAEKAAVKKKVEDANPGKTVTVDDKGNATVTDPTSGKTAIIPSTDLVEKLKEDTNTANKRTVSSKKVLPNTGTADASTSIALGVMAAVAGLGLVAKRRKEED
ncbi:Alpha-like protein 3 [Streptococcus sp. DD10]|nr:Alpha-like protein 3 [Streptococcus sp. DD10]